MALSVELVGPVLEEEGMRAYEWWAGEHMTLDDRLAWAAREREGEKGGR
jgi:hypothetical protein